MQRKETAIENAVLNVLKEGTQYEYDLEDLLHECYDILKNALVNHPIGTTRSRMAGMIRSIEDLGLDESVKIQESSYVMDGAKQRVGINLGSIKNALLGDTNVVQSDSGDTFITYNDSTNEVEVTINGEQAFLTSVDKIDRAITIFMNGLYESKQPKI